MELTIGESILALFMMSEYVLSLVAKIKLASLRMSSYLILGFYSLFYAFFSIYFFDQILAAVYSESFLGNCIILLMSMDILCVFYQNKLLQLSNPYDFIESRKRKFCLILNYFAQTAIYVSYIFLIN